MTVASPLAKWKENRRHRDARRVPLRGRACRKCGRTTKLTRHHEWETGAPGHPPKVKDVLCRDCHAELNRGAPLKSCRWCNATFPGKRSRRAHEALCAAKPEEKST